MGTSKVESALVKQRNTGDKRDRATVYKKHGGFSPDNPGGSEDVGGGPSSVLLDGPYKNSSSSESLLAARQFHGLLHDRSSYIISR